jgi:ribosomal protein S18 acetylase RimI-like enzyme
VIIREVAFGSAEYQQTLALREDVLRRPLGLDLSREDRAGEERQWHLIAIRKQLLVGCLVLVPLPGAAVQMRQVAVVPEAQRAGIGTALVAYAEELARSRKRTSMLLHARLEAVPFYRRLGYVLEGDEFLEVTIPHRAMRKAL